MQQQLSAITTICALILSGCVTGKKEFSFFGEGRVNIAGANQMLDPSIETFDDEHLVAILQPSSGASAQATVLDVEKAFRDANRQGVDHRNQIQERLILSSQQTCNFYKDYLRRIDGYKGFTLGSLTTALGAAAAIVTGAGAARALGGAAGITSGINAEFDQAFFKSIALHIITPGIDSRRDRVLKQIRDKQSKSINEYNVQASVADALIFHNQCTLNAGLEEAAESIKEVREPGLKTAFAVMSRIPEMQRAIQAIGASAVTGGPLPDSETPTVALEEAKQLVDSETKRILATISALEGTTDLKDKIAPIKAAVNKRNTETVASLDAEQTSVATIGDGLIKKNAALALASDEQSRSMLTDDIVTLKMRAKNLSKNIRSIAQNFKVFIQQQDTTLTDIVAATKANSSQPNPAK